jgi:tryptophanase
VYTQSHVEFVLEVAAIVASRRHSLRGFRVVEQPPFLRHFSAVLAPVDG